MIQLWFSFYPTVLFLLGYIQLCIWVEVFCFVLFKLSAMSFFTLKQILQQSSLNPSVIQKVFCFLLHLYHCKTLKSSHQFGMLLIILRFYYYVGRQVLLCPRGPGEGLYGGGGPLARPATSFQTPRTHPGSGATLRLQSHRKQIWSSQGGQTEADQPPGEPRLGLQTTLCPRPPVSWAVRSQTRGLDTSPMTSDLKLRDAYTGKHPL